MVREGVVTNGAGMLVVDDEPQIRRSLQVNLERSGYAVETVESGEDALSSFRNRRPDVVILDLIMPGMGGVEVVRRIRESSTVPIIVLSAMGEEARKVEALELGADRLHDEALWHGRIVGPYPLLVAASGRSPWSTAGVYCG